MRNYKIIRFYKTSDLDKKVIDTGLSLDEAQAHCKDEESCSKTCEGTENVQHTEQHGQWFDGYDEE